MSKEKVTTKNGMITASTLEADEATPKMLKRGQNAVDIRISPDVVVA